MIIGVSFTAIFAGDIPATFLRIPGTPASAAATLDGHALAQQGRGQFALLMDLFCSAIGGLIGVTLLIFTAPQLARFALEFSDYDYVWLAVMGLAMSALVSMGQTTKGIIAAVLGVLVSTVGQDPLSNVSRFTFGSVHLSGGLHFIPVMIGLFGLSEVLRNVRNPEKLATSLPANAEPAATRLALVEVWKKKWTVLKSAVAGTVIGALPGAGADIAAWGAYGIAKRTSKEGDQFGSGSTEGVIAPTSANNAAVGGAWIPALVFGVPGDAVTAIVLGVLLVHGIKTGPFLFEKSPDQVQSIFAIAIITQFLLIPCGYAGIKFFGWILRLPRHIVLVGVLVFSIVGSYALHNSLFDVYVMFAFGLIGFFLESKGFPLAPMILGLILGPLVEEKLRAGFIASSGSIIPFFNRPISQGLIAILLLGMLAKPLGYLFWGRLREREPK
jgi:TctA family transporter